MTFLILCDDSQEIITISIVYLSLDLALLNLCQEPVFTEDLNFTIKTDMMKEVEVKKKEVVARTP